MNRYNILLHFSMQIEIIMRYHFTPIRMAIINKLGHNKC